MEKKTEDAIIRCLEDIARSLRILSGREDNIRKEIVKESYKDKYFQKSE